MFEENYAKHYEKRIELVKNDANLTFLEKYSMAFWMMAETKLWANSASLLTLLEMAFSTTILAMARCF